ncbi:helix-turn-helix transcriptional regulator [Pseudorhodoplanes sp.]|uniref:helix-turn-helix transcriptional regulator n=1 Tax=Pseudorhodoplanes sp. TaxID=1934341 RepID=UPI003D09EA13
MNSSSARVTPRYVRTHDAAAYLGLSGRTLEKHRCTGTGPVFRKLGGRVVYAIEDLDAWAAERAQKSTSEFVPQTDYRGILSARPKPHGRQRSE